MNGFGHPLWSWIKVFHGFRLSLVQSLFLKGLMAGIRFVKCHCLNLHFLFSCFRTSLVNRHSWLSQANSMLKHMPRLFLMYIFSCLDVSFKFLLLPCYCKICLIITVKFLNDKHFFFFLQVYTFGPTFRAENSNTSRHLAEFWVSSVLFFSLFSLDFPISKRKVTARVGYSSPSFSPFSLSLD